MLFCQASLFSGWSFTPPLSLPSMASFQRENGWSCVVLGWFGRVFRFSAYHSNRLCHSFPFTLLWLLSFRELQETLIYDKGYFICSDKSSLSFCTIIWSFRTWKPTRKSHSISHLSTSLSQFYTGRYAPLKISSASPSAPLELL